MIPGSPVGPTAVEALRKARATWACGMGVTRNECAWSWLTNCNGRFHHADQASALLDGFSVAEVTAAERELER